MKIIRNILLLSLFLLPIASYAQELTLTGKVTDAATGESLPYASVFVKGTMNGTSTDHEGNYTISVSQGELISYTSIGFITVEVKVGKESVIDIALEPDKTLLDETIVVAYGTATKSSFTGSAAMVKKDLIEKRVSTNVTSALAGTTPGVQLISSSGDPASNGSAIRIRGIGSMSASSAPLYVLDGVPYDGSISDINSNDVESISILKDASASAIYGARGANGVVLITTRRAKSTDAMVRFDAKWGSNSRLIPQYDVIEDPALYYETHYRMMYNSQLYAGKSSDDAYAFADKNLFNTANGGLGYQVFTIPKGESFIGRDFKLNPNATLGYSDGKYTYRPDDWYNETFHNSFRHEYNISINGSSDRYSYYASAGYLNDGGVVANSGYERYTARINADYKVKKWLKVLTSMSYTHSDSKIASYDDGYGNQGNVFYTVNNIAPIYPLYVRDADGNIMYENGYPVFDANQTNFKRPGFFGNAVRDNLIDKTRRYSDVLTGKWGLVVSPLKGLDLTANVGIKSDNTRTNSLSSKYASGSKTDGVASVSQNRVFTVNSQYLVTYKTDFSGSKHNLDILAGYEIYNYKEQYVGGSNTNLFNPNIGELNNADGKSNKSANSYTNSYMTQGFLSRVQYNWNNRYFISASYRRDASSRFAKGHRWGDFGSFGFAWNITEETFMQNATWVNLLKLKASYGVQGNDNLNHLYPYSDTYNHSYNEDTKEYSVSLSYKGNKDITWETSHSLNFGLDFELFNGYLNGSLEYFHRTTTDLLFHRPVPLSAGNPTGRYPVNVGSMLNHGVELTLGGNIIQMHNVLWDWNFNLSHYKNKILSLDSSIPVDGQKYSNSIMKVGGTMYDAYMRRFAGVDPNTGKAMWYKKEIDSNGKYTGKDIKTDVFTEADQYDLGTVLPKVTGGFGTSILLYGVDLSVQFSFQLGGKYYDGTYQALMHTNGGTGTAWHKDALKAWTPENKNTDVPRLDGNSLVGQSAVDNYLISSNYFSVNNVTLGYSLPQKWISKIKLAGLRFYFAGENLAVVSARKGVDPRFSMGLGSYTSGSGLNSGAYSAMRTLTGGITLTF